MVQSFFRNLILGRVAQDIAAGKYGALLAKLYAGLKGRKTVIGGVVFLVGVAAVQFGHPQAAQFGALSITVGAILTSLGLIDKGTDKTPPRFDRGLSEAFAFLCSLITIFGKVAQLGVLLAQSSGKPWALHVSVAAQLIALACTTATGFLATYFVPPSHDYGNVDRFASGRSTPND